MQRKNSLLKKRKSGFAMIMAITVIVIITTIMALSLALTSQTTKRTTDVYLYEQASLYAKAAAEYALLQIAKDGPCTHHNDLNYKADLNGDGTPEYYDVNITANYVYTTPLPAGCINDNSVNDNVFTIVTTPEQNGSVLLDIAVSVNDTTISTEPLRYFRRTIQKL